MHCLVDLRGPTKSPPERTSPGDALKQMRDRAGVEAGLAQPFLDLLARCALLAMHERAGQSRPRSRTAEGKHLAGGRAPQCFLHRLDVGGTDAASNGHEAIGDSGLGGRCLDFRSKRLVRLLSVGAVIDQDGDALLRQPGDFLRTDLAAYQGAIVELADHAGPTSPSRRCRRGRNSRYTAGSAD